MVSVWPRRNLLLLEMQVLQSSHLSSWYEFAQRMIRQNAWLLTLARHSCPVRYPYAGMDYIYGLFMPARHSGIKPTRDEC